MRLFACLLALALANAATVPQKQPTPEKKLTEITEKDQTPLDNVSSEQDLIDPTNIAKDVENNLRKGASEVIPVAVVVEQAVKSDKEQANEVGIDCDDANNIKRVEIDLKNTGPPQRIEHDTQNPEHFDDGQTRLDNVDVKQEILDTENTFNGNAQNIQETIQNWVASNQHITNIQKNLETMKESVEAQISHMNQTIHKYWAPAAANIQSVAEGTKLNIQSGLKTLENNVQSGMKVLTNEIKAIGSKPEGSVKAEGEQPSPPAFPGNNQWFANFYEQWQNFTSIVQGQLSNMNNTWSQFTQNNNGNNTEQNNFFASIQQNFQNLFPQQQTQQDENSPQRPSIWQNIQNLFQGQAPPTPIENDPVQGTTAKPNRPIVQAIQTGLQNNPIIQGVQSIIRPPGNTPAQAQPAKPDQPTSDEGSNVVPEKPVEPEKQNEKPEVQQLPSGPIKQMIEKNPIMQGLAGAVQRIQHTIRPTSPREASDTQKGHHGGSSDGANNISHGVKTDMKPESSQKEPELPQKESEVEKPIRIQPESSQKEPEIPKPAEEMPVAVPAKGVSKKTE